MGIHIMKYSHVAVVNRAKLLQYERYNNAKFALHFDICIIAQQNRMIEPDGICAFGTHN